MPSETIEWIVAELKEDFTLLRRMSNSDYRPRAQDEKQWAHLAESLVRNGIAHHQYLKWAYEFYKRRFPLPFVNAVASDKTVKIFLDREPSMRDQKLDTELKCDLQRDTVAFALKNGRTPIEIVEDSTLELGVVFRYAVAHSAGLRELAEKLREKAERELHFNPHYREILGDYLPS